MAGQESAAPNTEWDGGEDETVTVVEGASPESAEPAATVTPATTGTETAQAGADKSGEKKSDATPPVQPAVQPAPPWRMTHVPPPNLAANQAGVAPKSEALPAKVELPLPDGYGESVELLKKISARVAKTKLEKHVKAAELKLIRSHIAKIQQGLPLTVIGANELATGHKSHFAALKQTKLEYLARQEPLVKELLAEYEKAVNEINNLRAQIVELQKPKK